MVTGETELNVALAEVLDGMRPRWEVKAEQTRNIRSRGKPDIMITEQGTAPVIIETEFMPATTVENDAKSRLDVEHKEYGKVSAIIAMRVPKKLRDLSGKKLRNTLENVTNFDFAIYSPDRFPKKGWLGGGWQMLQPWHKLYPSRVI